MKCPNCSDQIEECYLVGNEFGVIHCGCFYESDPDKVIWHFMKEIETEDYIIGEFKKDIFRLFNSRDDYQLNERAKMLEEELNCKIGTFEDLRTGTKKLIMEFKWYVLEIQESQRFCKIINNILREENNLIQIRMIKDLQKTLSCDKLEFKTPELPEYDIFTIIMEWKSIRMLTTAL